MVWLPSGISCDSAFLVRPLLIPKQARLINHLFSLIQAVCLATFVFVVWHPERFLSPPEISRIFIYLLLPAVLFALLQLAKRTSLSNKFNICLAGGSLLVGLFFLELIFAFRIVELKKKPIPSPREVAQKSSLPFDSRTLHEVVLELRARGVNAYPNGSGVDFVKTNGLLSKNGQIFPLSWISNQLVVYCNESGEFVQFTTDEHGFRNPNGLYRAGSLEIMLLGDSFTEGACVKEGDDLGSQIRRIHPNTLNLGKAGQGPPTQLAVLREFGPILRPKKVIWFFFENDLRNIIEQQESPLLMRYFYDADFSQNLFSRQKEIDVALRSYVDDEYAQIKSTATATMPHSPNPTPGIKPSALSIAKLTSLRQLLGISAYEQLPPGAKRIELTEFLSRAKTAISQWGGQLYLVYLPEFFSKTGDPSLGKTNFSHSIVQKAAEELKIPLIDLYPVFVNHPDVESLFPFRTGAHYGPKGYKLAAEEVLKSL